MNQPQKSFKNQLNYRGGVYSPYIPKKAGGNKLLKLIGFYKLRDLVRFIGDVFNEAMYF
jgi:hypothetical protein